MPSHLTCSTYQIKFTFDMTDFTVKEPSQQMGMLVSTAAIFSMLAYSFYRYLLPTPIPGIPYNEDGTKSLFGDIPRLQKESGDNVLGWMISQARRHGSPIVQFFLGPFRKPIILITDFREGQDILMRRKVFDRSDFAISTLKGEARSFHINLKTGPEWKAYRRLLQDLMTPKFLHGVAAPNIYKTSVRLLNLWKTKAKIAAGKSLNAEMDIFYAALDAVFDFGFGDAVQDRALTPQTNILPSMSECELQRLRKAAGEKESVGFAVAPISPAFEAVLGSVDNITGVASTGVPALAWWLLGLKPSVRRMRGVMDAFLKDQILGAARRYEEQEGVRNDDYVKSAIDLMVQRKGAFAKKDERNPVFWRNTMRDETLGFNVAGHDTTSTTLCLGVKFLSDNPNCQGRCIYGSEQVYCRFGLNDIQARPRAAY
ncbi:hypothetical protein CCHL11_03154 [Colletotrichum chlorophyti]|uniref:Uncharacterized protein n=1 Tax=Colletotrichum chlorophyti TaxID=708187 RepID=A0A1Q8RG24_9PEZI|nr:hypothetical protein CCHL11_03154 [Colletotrichum chlorophyti]